MAQTKPTANIISIFGAGGDLTWRKLIPALFDLYAADHLPEQDEHHRRGYQRF